MGTRRPPPEPPALTRLRRLAVDAPDDEAAHLVYADALLEAGDPRGDVIVQQCRDPDWFPSEAQLAHLAGPLYPHAEAFGVKRGMLRTLAQRRRTPTQLRRLVGRPAWDSIEALEFSLGRSGRPLPTAPVVDLVTHPVCRRLRSLYGLHVAHLCALRCWPRTLDVVFASMEGEGPPGDLDATPTRLRIHELVVLGAWEGVEPVAWLMTGGRPLLDGVEALVLLGEGFQVLELIADAPAGLARVSSDCATGVRGRDGWDLTLVPAPMPSLFHFASGDDFLFAAGELVRRLHGRVASLCVAGMDLGLEVASGMRTLGVPVRFEWKGALAEAPF